MFESVKPHLVELRQRLGIAVGSIFVGFVIAFIFHNAILGWVTKPLNEALEEVGRIVESRDMAGWKVSGGEMNASKIPATATAVSTDRTAVSPAKDALKLSDDLSRASEIIGSDTASERDKALASLLSDAAISAKKLSEEINGIYKRLDRDRGSKKDELRHKSFEGMITTHQVGGAFFVALKVSFFAGILLALPMILWQIWQFVAPGLYENEKKMLLPFVVGGSVMFMIGVLFAYYVVTPFGFQFLITFGSFLYTPLINIEDYVGFFTKIMFGFGLAFELPIFTYFLALLGLITDRTLKDFFKYAIVLIFLVAALLTPPDVLTQMLMAAPLLILYGVSILIVGMVNPEPEDEEEES